MFQLRAEEWASLRTQFVISSSWGGRRTAPHAFTEQGVAMLSSVLRSPRAVQVNIEIMRAFVRLRQMLHKTPNWRESSPPSKRNTTPNSRSSLTPSAS
jgi:hypothetical protein